MSDLNNGATIDSLETYFSHIENLLGLTKPQDSRYGRKYSILPVMNEGDYFQIDANTRTIKVPESFRKNGLGVQGDQTAETIYFKVNRYFDAMDLYNTDIYIQWENANGDAGFAKEWVRDIHTYDDYMIFGWVLGDLITSVPGILKFSVRFIKTNQKEGTDEKVITYSLNTLTAQAMINSSLDHALTTANDSLNNILAGNFKNTTTQTDSEIRVFKFVYNFDNLIAEDKSNFDETSSIISADLINGQLELLVSAYIEPGTLTYNLYKQIGDSPEPNGTDRDDKVAMTFDYKLTPDKAVQLDKVYYILENGNYKQARLEDMGGQNAAIPIGKYYEKYGKYVLSADTKINDESLTGYYYATAVGKTADNTESSPMVSDYRVLLSPPEKAIINGDVEIGGKETGVALTVEATIPEHNTPTYKWFIKKYTDENYIASTTEETNVFTPTEEALYKVEVWTTRNLDSIKADNDVVYTVTNRPNAETDINIVSDGGSFYAGTIGPRASYAPLNAIADYSLAYQWYKVVRDEEDNEIEPVIIDGANKSTYDAEPGEYRCDITAIYNGLSDTYRTKIFSVVSGE